MRVTGVVGRRVGGLVAAAGLVVALVATSAEPTSASVSVDRSNRASVATLWKKALVPALSTSTAWTGSAAGCKAGTTSAASQKATLAAVNSVRALAGLSPVKLSSTLTKKAQKAALVFKANSTATRPYLSHNLTRGLKCYSTDAKTAAARSNIAASAGSGPSPVAGAKAILGYLDEPGAGNSAAGHRRWILSPDLGSIGVGSTTSTNALYVLGRTAKKYKNPTWVTWPTSGYFPNQLEPEGLWSISGKGTHGKKTYNFSHAKVTVRTAAGKKLTVHKYPVEYGYGSDTLVFKVSGVKKPSGTSVARYTVTLSGVKKAGKKVKTLHYTVKLFNPAG